MAWTYEKRMARAIARLINSDILDADAHETLRRAKFFGKYAFCVGLSLTADSWTRFPEIKVNLTDCLSPFGAHIVAMPKTYDFYVYGNDPNILKWIEAHNTDFFVNSIRECQKEFWGNALPRTKTNKASFYGEYRFRLQMKNRLWGTEQTNIDQMEELDIDHKIVCRAYSHSVSPAHPQGFVRDTFLYVKKLNEVLVLKLMFGDQIKEVDDRLAT